MNSVGHTSNFFFNVVIVFFTIIKISIDIESDVLG